VVMGVRDYLREQRSRFRTQEDMLAFIERESGERVAQSTLSLWLSGKRGLTNRHSLQTIRKAFAVSDRKWKQMLWADMVEAEDGEALNPRRVRTA